MDGLGDTTRRLAHFRRIFGGSGVGGGAASEAGATVAASRLIEVDAFGSNPGNLRMLVHRPSCQEIRPALVVALHGCTQTGAVYDHGTGWSALAERQGFLVLLPEQRQSGNPNLCFNWFVPGNITRDQGEALSIRQMIAHAVKTYGVDPARVFVTGLSAGGAMTSVMLATYPEVFAAGAIIAGLPYGSAGTLAEALEAMSRSRPRAPRQWGGLVRQASAHAGPWPRVSVWHGDADAVVSPLNAEASVAQWLSVHEITAAHPEENRLGALTSRRWRGDNGGVVLESHTVAGMGHGVPLDLSGPKPVGAAGVHQFDVGVPSTEMIAASFGLVPAPVIASRPSMEGSMAAEAAGDAAGFDPTGVGTAVIAALRKAGLMNAKAPGIKPGAAGGKPVDPSEIVEAVLRSVGIERKK